MQKAFQGSMQDGSLPVAPQYLPSTYPSLLKGPWMGWGTLPAQQKSAGCHFCLKPCSPPCFQSLLRCRLSARPPLTTSSKTTTLLHFLAFFHPLSALLSSPLVECEHQDSRLSFLAITSVQSRSWCIANPQQSLAAKGKLWKGRTVLGRGERHTSSHGGLQSPLWEPLDRYRGREASCKVPVLAFPPSPITQNAANCRQQGSGGN